MLEVIAGDGIIKQGTGTAGDPFIISSHISVNQGTMTQSQYAAVFAGVGQYNEMDSANVNGSYYKFEVTVDNSGVASERTETLNDGTSITYQDGSMVASNRTPTSSTGSGDLVLGQERNNAMGFYYNNMSGFSGMSESAMIERSTTHEIGHSLGLADGDAAVMNGFSASSSGYITGSPGAIDAQTLKKMLSGSRVHWGSGIAKP